MPTGSTRSPRSSVVEHSPGTGAAQVRFLAGAHVSVAQLDSERLVADQEVGGSSPSGNAASALPMFIAG